MCPPLVSSLNTGLNTGVDLSQNVNCPVGGRLSLFWERWSEIGASRRVLRWLKFGYPLKFKDELVRKNQLPALSFHAPKFLLTSYQNPVKQLALQQLVSQLVTKRCVQEMSPSEKGYFSRVFVVPKKSGGWRLVIDLSELNKYLAQVTFSMDTLVKVKRAASPGMWATSLDLSDAYHHIPMRPQSQVFLCFQLGDKRYRFRVLPFGLMSAPWVFTEVMKQIKKWALSNHLILFQYLDDWLNLHMDRQVLLQSTERLVCLCVSLGLLVNFEKSELTPSQSIVFLGERLELAVSIAYALPDRVSRIQSLITAALARSSLPLDQAESLLGVLVATYPTVPLGRLYLRSLQWHVIRAVRRGRALNPLIVLDPLTRSHLRWWACLDNLSRGQSFLPPAPQLTVFTDASLQGWGVAFQDRTFQGRWTRSSRHINWLELRAVLSALQLLQFQLSGKPVLFLLDNTTAVAYLNNQGGTRSRSLLKLSLRIFQLAESLQIHLAARHITGQLNVLADLASRVGQVVPSEWSLCDEAFTWLITQSPWGPPHLDLFANRLNHRVPRYVSPCQDSAAWAVDALSCRLPADWVIYAFPPVCLLHQFLLLLQRLPAYRVLLVVQCLPLSRFAQRLLCLPVVRRIPFPLFPGLLRQPHWDHVIQSPASLHLTLMCLEKNVS